MKPSEYIAVYLAAVSIVAMAVMIYDKIASKHFTKNRIRESTLLFIAAIGGSVAMFLTMIIIRHKTRKPKFSVGVPVIIVIHLILTVLLYLKGVI